MKLLKNSLYIFKTDWVRILKNPLTLIVISGLMIIPSLYAWFNIEALWDPYGNASNLPIGVYSTDIGVDINGENINIGEGIVEELKEDTQLNWQFVDSKEQLTKSVQNGDFYGSIYIPEDFTAKLLSIVSGQYEKPILEYTVNEKINAIAPKMTEAGAEGVSQGIVEGFNQALSSVVLELANKFGIQLNESLPVLQRFFNKVHKLNKITQDIGNYLTQINDFNTNVEQNKYNFGSIDLEKIIGNIDNLGVTIHQINEKMPSIIEFGNNIKLTDDNIQKLQTLTNEVNNINTMISNVNFNIENIKNTIEKINQDYIKYSDFFKNIIDQNNLSTTLKNLEVTIDDVNKFVDDIYNILANSFDVLELLSLKLSDISYNLSTFLNNTTLTPTDITNIINALNSLNNIGDNITTLITNIINVLIPINIITSGSLTNIIDTLNNINGYILNIQTVVDYVINNINSLDASEIIDYLNNIVSLTNNIVRDINSLDLERLKNEIKTSLNSVKEMITNTELNINNINLEVIKSLNDSLNNIINITNTTINKFTNNDGDLKSFINQLDTFLQANTKDIINLLNSINKFFKDDINNVAQSFSNADNFMQNDWKTVKSKLNTNITSLKEQIPNLKQTLKNISTFSETTWENIENSINHLDQKVTQISENEDIEEMIEYLKNDVKKGSDFIANPVQLETKRMYPVENYGSASTPFYTTLCLWVGGVLLTSVLSTHFHKENISKKLTDKEVFLGRFFTFVSIAIIQSLIVALGDIYLLKVIAISPYWFIIFTVLISICFTTIIYTLANLFGNVGKALAVVGLVLSISGGGGNFPIEVSGEFFQVINPLLPFTHGVNLLREPIGGIYPPTVYISLIVLGLYTIIFLTIGLFGANFINPIMKKLEEKSHESHIFH